MHVCTSTFTNGLDFAKTTDHYCMLRYLYISIKIPSVLNKLFIQHQEVHVALKISLKQSNDLRKFLRSLAEDRALKPSHPPVLTKSRT